MQIRTITDSIANAVTQFLKRFKILRLLYTIQAIITVEIINRIVTKYTRVKKTRFSCIYSIIAIDITIQLITPVNVNSVIHNFTVLSFIFHSFLFIDFIKNPRNKKRES